jgi:alpha-galactosidase
MRPTTFLSEQVLTVTQRLTWGNSALELSFEWGVDLAVCLVGVRTKTTEAALGHDLPFAELVTARRGHTVASDRLVHTSIGEALRYVSHTTSMANGWTRLVIEQQDAASGLKVEIQLGVPDGIPAVRSTVRVTNMSGIPVVLRSIASFATRLGALSTGSADFGAWQLVSGKSDWLGEGRWQTRSLRGDDFPVLGQQLTGHDLRGQHAVVSTGTWSSGKNLPVGALVRKDVPLAWAWQIEHNGPWRWEVGEDSVDGYLALSGPTEGDHGFTRVLRTGHIFETVPVTFTVAANFIAAVGHLTEYRRAARRKHPDNETLGVVFNDYMNTLNGDPTTEKLMPLIDAAAEVGCEFFCIDAGWYDESGSWWDSVGEWLPSKSRFPGGLGEVIEHIRSKGMVPGLWLEPEVVGVRSPMARRLPEKAFLQRNGVRIVEHQRYHLDLRHPAAIAHLNQVVDNLVNVYGVGFFKLDYNIDPGAGTDVDADSIGSGLLDHNRAHLKWLDAVLDRYPDLVLENCSSGGMRMDFAMLSRLQMQSTSDQQDPLKYPPIAAAAPVSMLPEQAANWAFPQPEMNDEEIAFALATGLLGRFYLSGYFNRMSAEQRILVTEAVRAYKGIRSEISRSLPFWPLGLPDWTAPWVALGLHSESSDLVTIWNRSGQLETVLRFPDLKDVDVLVETVFPQTLASWTFRWSRAEGTLAVRSSSVVVGARTIRLRTVIDHPGSTSSLVYRVNL